MLELLDFIGRHASLDENHIATRTLKAMRSSAEGSPAAADAWLREALREGDASDAQTAQFTAVAHFKRADIALY
jgi:hypothetical protein